MSHWTTVKTKIQNEVALRKTLKEMFPKGKIVNKAVVRGFAGRTRNADIVLQGSTTGYNSYDIGFSKQADGTYSLLADWWGAKAWAGQQEKFTSQLSQLYSKHIVLEQAKAEGWYTEKNVREGEEIVLELTQF